MNFHRPDPDLIRVRALLIGASLDLKLLLLERAWKAFNPDQPRVPAGTPEGGRWSDGDALTQGTDRVRVAQRLPPRNHNNPPGLLPPEKPTGRGALSEALRRIAAISAERLAMLAGASPWVTAYMPLIRAAQDPPKSLSELQDAVANPGWGYDIHHIVEQSAARRDGYGEDEINARHNLVRIPTVKHWEINSWYSSRSDMFGGRTPREYLSDKSWQERYEFGLDQLKEKGVLLND